MMDFYKNNKLQTTNYKLQTRRGFTLIEMLLSIAIIGAIAAMSAPIYQALQVRNDLDIAATTIAQAWRRGAILSQASYGDTTWGVHIVSGSITLFKGASYAARDTAYDEVFDLPTNITPSGVGDVVFAKFTGLPQTTGTTTLTSTANETRNIGLNAVGRVSF